MGTKQDYRGPGEVFDHYDAAISDVDGVDRLGAANPYTSLNGWMTSFLDRHGNVAVRLAPEKREAFIAEHDAELALQYGTVMQEFPVVPTGIVSDKTAMADLLRQSHEWVATLPKPKKRTKKKAAKKATRRR